MSKSSSKRSKAALYTPEELAKARNAVEKDPDWPLVSASDACAVEQLGQWRRACSRITKKAVCALYPGHAIRVRCKSSGWICVDLTMSEHSFEALRHLRRDDPKRWEYKSVIERVRTVLKALGIRYEQYLPDCIPGEDEWKDCLSVSVNQCH